MYLFSCFHVFTSHVAMSVHDYVCQYLSCYTPLHKGLWPIRE